ncbi:MAG: SEC-C domain-containing protein [Anaerolineae bacterium]
MLRAKRNDLCPCGSGKKYKNCCLRADQIGASREVNLSSGEALLLTELYQYAQLPRFNTALFAAFGLYWGGAYDISAADALGQESLRAMLEWFIHDYAVDGNGRHVIDLFIEDRVERYPAEARLLLDGWAASTMGLWRVLSLDGSAQVSLFDLLREEPLEVYSPMLAHHALVGDLVMGRRVLAGETYLLAAMASLLPAEYEQPLGDYVRHAERLYREEHYQATWDTFLRANGHLFNAFMLSARADGLRSLIGAGTRYRDPAEARDRLRARTAELQAEAQRKARQAEQTRSGIRQTSSGLIVPGAPTPTDEQDEAPRPRILLPGRDL